MENKKRVYKILEQKYKIRVRGKNTLSKKLELVDSFPEPLGHPKLGLQAVNINNYTRDFTNERALLDLYPVHVRTAHRDWKSQVSS